MDKVYKFNKYLYSFMMSVMSIFVFMIEFKRFSPFYSGYDHSFLELFSELCNSIKSFDIIYVTLWIFIFNFYSNIYFDDNKYGKKSIICSLISLLFSVMTLIFKSYMIDNTLNSLYSSDVQIVKMIIFIIGYYFIYYAIFKKIMNIRIDKIKVKKKVI